MMVRFGIVGAGWRVRWFLRAARALAGQLEVAGLAARRPQRAVDLASAYGVTLYRSPSEMIAAEAPDFVVTSVPSSANPHIIRQLVEQDIPVLSETPPAGTVEEMRALWALQEQGARIQVAEQYWRQPHHAARLAFAHSGRLGRISQVQCRPPTATTASASCAASSASAPSPQPSPPAASPLRSCKASPVKVRPAPRS